jgi:hypothetical protein
MNEFVRPVIRDAVQVKVFKHVALGSSAGRLCVSRDIMPAFAAPGNRPRRALSSLCSAEIRISRCPFRKSSASFGPCFLAWLQMICAAKLAA